MDYAALAETAADLIAEYGQPATLRRVMALGFDPGLTITVDATGCTFTRSSGSWIADGFVSGDSITFAGFADAGNNAAFVASGVEALILTCSTATGLVGVVDATGITATANHDTPVSVLEQSINSIRQYADSLVPGSLITDTTRFYQLVSGAPAPNDLLIIAGVQYVVESSRPFSPGATPIYHEVRVKA